jgi:hypothetical protein
MACRIILSKFLLRSTVDNLWVDNRTENPQNTQRAFLSLHRCGGASCDKLCTVLALFSLQLPVQNDFSISRYVYPTFTITLDILFFASIPVTLWPWRTR